MNTFATENCRITPRELFVYECWGARTLQGEPGFEGYLGLWPEPPFYYLFADRQVLSQVEEWVRVQPGWELRNTYRLDYEQWQQGGLEPCRVGSFHIAKDGREVSCQDSDTIIRLHPGLVFGSGLHPTTQACLLLIERFHSELSGARVIDLGTGTGILAIACARLGASTVVAIDSNPMATRETLLNIRLNHLERVVHPVLASGLDSLNSCPEWIVMNIEYPVLCQVLQEGAWSRYSHVLMSGFMASQWCDVRRLITRSHQLLDQLECQGWCAVALQNGTEHLRENAEIIPA